MLAAARTILPLQLQKRERQTRRQGRRERKERGGGEKERERGRGAVFQRRNQVCGDEAAFRFSRNMSFQLKKS